MTSSNVKPGFLWKGCADKDEEERIQIKENAVLVGLEYAKRLETRLYLTLKGVFDATDDTGDSILRKDQLKNLTRHINSCEQGNKDRTCTIGLMGTTGTGKTSLINAMINCEEVLPPNSMQAGTASACRVSYNTENDPRKLFRAEVQLQNEKSMRDELEGYYGVLREITEAEEDDEPFEHIEDLKSQTKSMASKIQTIWGFDEERIETMSATRLLRSNFEIRNLLRKKISIYHNDSQAFSEKIRPYIDSTPAAHCSDGREFCIWPLVEVVDIYIKDPLLKLGITLIDLPGHGDTNENRVDVTRKHLDQLDLAAVLTPSLRAGNDKSSLGLLTGAQERAMQMDGKYKANTFAIAIGKIDDIDHKSFARGCPELKTSNEYQRIQDRLDRATKQTKVLPQQNKVLQKQVKNAGKAVKKARQEHKKAGGSTFSADKKDKKKFSARRQITKAEKTLRDDQKSLERIENQLENAKKTMKVLDSEATFYCIRERSKIQEKELKSHYRNTQIELARKVRRSEDQDDISVFPISSKAYWKLQDGEIVQGFPSIPYTGIPSFRAWVEVASIPMREANADITLKTLEGILRIANTYSERGSDEKNDDFDRAMLRSELHESTNKKLRKGLRTVFDNLLDEVRKIKRLTSIHASRNEFCNYGRVTINRWSFKFPHDQSNNIQISWPTYQACLKRKGDVFMGSPKSGGVRYAWIEDITALFENTVKTDWNELLNNRIPNVHNTPAIAQEFDDAWNSFFERVITSVKQISPDRIQAANDKMEVLDIIKQETRNRLGTALKDVSQGARSIRQEFESLFSQNLGKVFEKALKITGEKSNKERRGVLKNFSEEGLDIKYFEVMEGISLRLTKQVRILRATLDNIINEAVTKCDDTLASMTSSNRKVAGRNFKMEYAFSEKSKLQDEMNTILAEWAIRWQCPDETITFARKKGSYGIPQQFILEESKDEEENEDELSDDMMEDIDSGGDKEDESSGE